MNTYYRSASFLKSAARLDQAPPDAGMEVAFAGRSNSGKSSALNTLCQQKSLARTSKTPGRTQLLNFFELDGMRRLVDLPGYGYAKVAEATKRRWQESLEAYLVDRRCLRGLILLMDCRHPLKEFDWTMLEWNAHHGLPAHVLLTKADKLKRGAAASALHQVRRELAALTGGASVQLFSSLKRQGIDEAHAVLDHWLELEATQRSDVENTEQTTWTTGKKKAPEA